MKITLTIPNVSTNKLYTNSRTTGKKILTSIARATKEAWAWEAKTQFMGKDPYSKEIEIRIDLYFPDRRRRDADNTKALFDAMTGILWDDDSLIAAYMTRKHIVPGEEPKIIITLPYELPK